MRELRSGHGAGSPSHQSEKEKRSARTQATIARLAHQTPRVTGRIAPPRNPDGEQDPTRQARRQGEGGAGGARITVGGVAVFVSGR